MTCQICGMNRVKTTCRECCKEICLDCADDEQNVCTECAERLVDVRFLTPFKAISLPCGAFGLPDPSHPCGSDEIGL